MEVCAKYKYCLNPVKYKNASSLSFCCVPCLVVITVWLPSALLTVQCLGLSFLHFSVLQWLAFLPYSALWSSCWLSFWTAKSVFTGETKSLCSAILSVLTITGKRVYTPVYNTHYVPIFFTTGKKRVGLKQKFFCFHLKPKKNSLCCSNTFGGLLFFFGLWKITSVTMRISHTEKKYCNGVRCVGCFNCEFCSALCIFWILIAPFFLSITLPRESKQTSDMSPS